MIFFLFLFTLLYFSVHTFWSVYTEGFRDLNPAHSVDRWNRIANHFWWFLKFFSLSRCLSIFINSVCALEFCFGQRFIWWFSSFDYLSISIGVYKWTSTKMAAFEIVLTPCSWTAVVVVFIIFKQISTRSLRDIQFTIKREQIGNILERFSFSNRKQSGQDVCIQWREPTEKSTV